MSVMIRRKTLLGFKHVRFKSDSKDVLLMRTLKLAELLDCTTFTAREIMGRNVSLLSISSFEFSLNAKFCGQFLRLSDVVELPCLLSLNPSMLQNRFMSLQELGCTNVSGISILRYQQLLKKSQKALAKENLNFDPELRNEMCQKLVPLEDREVFWERLERLQADRNAPLRQLRELINAEAFAVKLGCSLATSTHLFRRFPPLRSQSARTTLQVFDVLTQKFRFNNNKICNSSPVLSIHPEALSEFTEQIPTFLGVEIVELVRRLPLLLRKPTQRIKEVEQVLREAGVQGTQLLCCPKVALMCPHTLRTRLQAVSGVAELRALRPHRRFLWLVYCFGRLEERMQALRQAPSDSPLSIAAFTASEERFEKSLRSGDRRRSGEALAYLAAAAAVPEAEVTARLPERSRPRLPDCSRVVEFLRGEGVTRVQLAHGLEAALYDLAVVRAHWEALKARPQWAERWADHHNVLQLLVYSIEIETGFRGAQSTQPQLVYNI